MTVSMGRFGALKVQFVVAWTATMVVNLEWLVGFDNLISGRDAAAAALTNG